MATHQDKIDSTQRLFEAGGFGVGRCLAGAFFFSNQLPFPKQRAPVWGVASQRHLFFKKITPFSFWDTIFRVNVANSTCLPSTNSLSEFIGGITGIPGNATHRAGPDLWSTRAWGKDDGS